MHFSIILTLLLPALTLAQSCGGGKRLITLGTCNPSACLETSQGEVNKQCGKTGGKFYNVPSSQYPGENVLYICC
ncbi:hypothetical protein Vi05172_g5202 [Venturia inaequalis]|nr:hypothetical protein Vi05172_g5202 [Venturia inaequalis]